MSRSEILSPRSGIPLGLTIAAFSVFVVPLSNSYSSVPPDKSDSTSTFVVNKIILEGNNLTKPYVILRELPFKEGDSVTMAQLDYARERIYSTGLFTKVLIQPEPVSKTRIDLLIYVEERWYIWPYPILWFRDRVLNWKKVSAGFGIIDYNFRGMAKALAACSHSATIRLVPLHIPIHLWEEIKITYYGWERVTHMAGTWVLNPVLHRDNLIILSAISISRLGSGLIFIQSSL